MRSENPLILYISSVRYILLGVGKMDHRTNYGNSLNSILNNYISDNLTKPLALTLAAAQLFLFYPSDSYARGHNPNKNKVILAQNSGQNDAQAITKDSSQLEDIILQTPITASHFDRKELTYTGSCDYERESLTVIVSFGKTESDSHNAVLLTEDLTEIQSVKFKDGMETYLDTKNHYMVIPFMKKDGAVYLVIDYAVAGKGAAGKRKIKKVNSAYLTKGGNIKQVLQTKNLEGYVRLNEELVCKGTERCISDAVLEFPSDEPSLDLPLTMPLPTAQTLAQSSPPAKASNPVTELEDYPLLTVIPIEPESQPPVKEEDIELVAVNPVQTLPEAYVSAVPEKIAGIDNAENEDPLYKSPLFWVLSSVGVAAAITGTVVGVVLGTQQHSTGIEPPPIGKPTTDPWDKR